MKCSAESCIKTTKPLRRSQFLKCKYMGFVNFTILCEWTTRPTRGLPDEWDRSHKRPVIEYIINCPKII